MVRYVGVCSKKSDQMGPPTFAWRRSGLRCRKHRRVERGEARCLLRGCAEEDARIMRSKTVVTVISKISAKAVGNDGCLVVIYGLELGRKYNLEQANIVIGRSSKSDVQIDQESVSRNHAKIINTGKSIILRDLGSTNGTYVNDQLIDEYVLRDGDFVKIGRTI